MSFTLLPAIDVAEGRLAVFTPDGPRPLDAFGGDPLAAAAAYVTAGARWVHLVDMDRAFGHDGGTADLLAQLRASHPGLRIQASGGITSADLARASLDAGADRVVLGSAILADEAATRAALTVGGSAILVGIEVEEGRIRGRGPGRVELDLPATLGWLVADGVPGVLVTAVGRVGARSGPDVDLVAGVARAGCPTFAAGGIRSLEDLRALRAAGAVGAVVGRAALERELDLASAIAWASA